MGGQAVVGLKPPKELHINNEEDMSKVWKTWIQQYQWYEAATNLKKKKPDIQVATFMTIIGKDAAVIYNTFNIKEQDLNNLDMVKKIFEEYFVPKINVTYERYVFNKIEQKYNESFDEFLTRLRSSCKNCAFAKLEDSLICDRIVVGINNDTIRERLLAEDKLTLELAINICRASEQARKQLKNIKDSPEQNEQQIDAVRKPKKQYYNQREKQKKETSDETFKCGRCGKEHGRRNCPAFRKICKKCRKPGHFMKCCRAKNVSTIKEENEETEDTDDEVLYVNTIERRKTEQEDWYETLKLPQQVKVKFKLDSGAQCNVITEDLAMKARLKMQKSKTKSLLSFSNHKIEVKGECRAEVEFREKKENIKFIVVDSNVQPILGKSTCVQLKLIKRVEMVQKDMFEGIGCLKGFTYDIDLVDNPILPIHPPRKIPHAIKEEVRQELKRMTRLGIIEPITEPTPAVSPMVVVRQNNKLRICIDPSEINKNLKRRHYPLNTLEEIAAKVNGSKWFTLLDCKKGFWQVKVSKRTSKYLTFATPWGRYKCKRLPFGLASAPEVFQQIMCDITKDITGVECSMDDVLIHAKSQKELEKITTEVLEKMKEAGLKLNKDKCKFTKNKIKFLGHILTDQGILPDPEKVETISQVRTPSNVKELQRFLGMVTYLSKFIHNLSELTAPLRELLKKEVEWYWDLAHEEAFQKLKEQLRKLPRLKYFDPKEEITLSVDASSKAVGAVALQKGRPIAYSAKALTTTQQNYSQIEKEAYAIVTACKKFHEYVYGNKRLEIETDHKPLETIFKKPIHEAPARLQKMMIEVLPYNPVIRYKKGSELYIADTLSRDCELKSEQESKKHQLEIHMVIPMSKARIKQAKNATNQSNELSLLKEQILKGWPEKRAQLPEQLHKYWTFKEQLSCHEDLIFKNKRLLIPEEMRQAVVKNSHLSHKGINGSLRLARDNVFWPKMTRDIVEHVNKCRTCNKLQPNKPKEPILQQQAPSRPWSTVASDLFQIKENYYIVIADSYSGYFDFKRLKTITSKEIIKALKQWFAEHGIPDVLLTDNGRQYVSEEFKSFAEEWKFNHRKSSPEYPRSNGLAERYVKEAKNLIKKCTEDDSDIYLALLHHRNTPRENLGSPVQRLMSRRTKTLLPTHEQLLYPKPIKNVKKKLTERKSQEKRYGDQNTRVERKFNKNENILYKNKNNEWLQAKILKPAAEPRSYIIKTKEGRTYRKNSWFLRGNPGNPITNTDDEIEEKEERRKEVENGSEENSTRKSEIKINETPRPNSQKQSEPNQTRSGRNIIKPEKLDL